MRKCELCDNTDGSFRLWTKQNKSHVLLCATCSYRTMLVLPSLTKSVKDKVFELPYTPVNEYEKE